MASVLAPPGPVLRLVTTPASSHSRRYLLDDNSNRQTMNRCFFVVGFVILLSTSWAGAEMMEAILFLPSQIPVQVKFPNSTPPPPPPPPRYPDCQNQQVGRLMAINIRQDAHLSQKAVEVAVRDKYSGSWYVSCGYEPVAFSKSSPNYCQYSNGQVWCYVFQPYQ